MALYHKYRPQTFKELVGQEHVTKTLTNQLKENDFAHAYLFSGPRGIGKTTTARILAKALNCPKQEDSEVEPDNSTKCAEEINNSRSIDVIEIDAASHTGVQNVREQIIENAQFQPTKLDYKIFIIDEVHMLSKSAFNALLKTLEEPPEHVVFVLATTEPHELPDTIISRCQRFDFKKISHDKLKKYLKKITKEEDVKVSEEIIERVINKSDGCARDAISLLDQLIAAGGGKIDEETASLVLPKTNNEDALKFVGNLIDKNIKVSLKQINNLADDGVNIVEFTLKTIDLLRYMMIKKSGAKANRAGVDLVKETKIKLEEKLDKISYNEIVELIDLCLDRKSEIKQAPIPQLPLELLILEWCDANTSTQKTTNQNKDNTPNITKEEKENKQTKQKTSQKNNSPNSKSDEETTNKTKNSTKTNTKSKSVQANWESFIEEVEERSPSLVFILKMANIVKNDSDQVRLEVKYGFHKEKLTQNNNMKKIEEAMQQALDEKVQIEIQIQENESEQNDDEVNELASALGGEVVN